MTKPTLTIIVNGNAEQAGADESLAALLERRRPRPPFAVEVNRALVRRDSYEAIRFKDGDCIEIVTLVGGG